MTVFPRARGPLCIMSLPAVQAGYFTTTHPTNRNPHKERCNHG